MHERVHSQIRIGDPAQKVQDLLGTPDTFGASQRVEGAQAWYYTRGADICGFTIEKETVNYYACDRNPNHVSTGMVVGSMLKGMGDGINNQNSRRISCTSTTLGVRTDTECN